MPLTLDETRKMPDLAIAGADCPRLLRGVRTRYDRARGIWVLLAPERTLKLDAIGAAVLEEVDGVRSFDAVVDRLASRFKAPRDRIARDAATFLLSLRDRRMLEIDPS